MTQAEIASEEPPTKRLKLSTDAETTLESRETLMTEAPETPEAVVAMDKLEPTSRDDADAEARVGILQYVSPENPGFSGILKQRLGSTICLPARWTAC